MLPKKVHKSTYPQKSKATKIRIILEYPLIFYRHANILEAEKKFRDTWNKLYIIHVYIHMYLLIGKSIPLENHKNLY